MHDLNDLYYFVQAVEYGGFAQAGRELGVPKSKLSRRIAALEARLGVKLIQRSTRHFTVTGAGQIYLEHCKAMLLEAVAAQEAMTSLSVEPSGVIRMTCPIALLRMHVGTILADFMARYPRITVHLEATNRRVDVIGEGIDVAIRVRQLPLEDSDLVMRVLSDRGQCLVASPDCVARHATPVVPEDLDGWPSLALSIPQKNYRWQLYGQGGEEVTLQHYPRFVTTDMHALKLAALQGIGVAQLPLLLVQTHIKQGSLVRLLPDWAPRREVIHTVFASRRGLLPSTRALIDFLAERYAAIDED